MEALIQRCGLLAANGLSDAEVAQYLVEGGICSPEQAFLAMTASKLLLKWDNEPVEGGDEPQNHGHGWWR